MNSANALTLDVYRKMHDEQARLLRDLEDIYALVNVCRLALEDKGLDETDSTSVVLMLAVNSLFDMQERETERCKATELLAYPERQEGAQS